MRRSLLGLLALLVLGLGRGPAGRPHAWAFQVPGSPEPLTAAEESDPRAFVLARHFNPAMVLPDAEGPWPTPVAYTWSGGADLRARTVDSSGRAIRDAIAVSNRTLETRDWGDLPSLDREGNRIEYWVDAPGDDRIERGASTWRHRWREASGRVPPTQYAHLFWLSRKDGLLAIQYWFFFPFNEWINHHEGDWEHVNVILKGPTDLAPASSFRPIAYEFYFHEWRMDVPADQITHDGDHPTVFVGGRGRFLWWTGRQSGGSYPWRAVYPGIERVLGAMGPTDDTRAPGHYLPASRFDVVLLPEPSRLDTRARPALSWLKLPFLAGQPQMHGNPLFVDRFGGGKPPRQPARRQDWNAVGSRPLWPGAAGGAVPARPTVTLAAAEGPGG